MVTLVLERPLRGHETTSRPAAAHAPRVSPGLFTRLVDAFMASRMARVEHEVQERLGTSLAELRAEAERRYRAIDA